MGSPRMLLSIVILAASAGLAQPPRNYPTLGRIVREDPRLDALLPADAQIEVLASGFDWAEGPVWDRHGGYLLFSDVPRNTIYKWTHADGVTVFLKPSGYTGAAPRGGEPGSNGLTFDSQGRLISMEHGDRRVALMEREGGKRTLADNYQGKRLNSPNDGIVKSNGDIYFTDPPYGLVKNWDDPQRELDFCGVYRIGASGQVTLLTKELTRPNGLAFSPGEKILYVANSDPQRAIWMAYPVLSDGTLGAGRVFADVTAMAPRLPGLPDGMKVDAKGNLFATGPGGVHIYAPDGKLLGRLETGEATANVAWGDDGSTLYITADMYLCRIKTTTQGAGW
jgi:gluconolactonase